MRGVAACRATDQDHDRAAPEECKACGAVLARGHAVSWGGSPYVWGSCCSRGALAGVKGPAPDAADSRRSSRLVAALRATPLQGGPGLSGSAPWSCHKCVAACGCCERCPHPAPLRHVLCILPGKAVVLIAGSHRSEPAGAAGWAGSAASPCFLPDLGILCMGSGLCPECERSGPPIALQPRVPLLGGWRGYRQQSASLAALWCVWQTNCLRLVSSSTLAWHCLS